MACDTNNCIKSVRERLSSMLQTGRWTDCKFLVGTELQVVEGHKMILASASPVFEAMFYGEMSERQTTISIPDITPAAFKAMLQYIYTDDIKLTSLDDAFDLYYAANKYILPNLEQICIIFVKSNLSTDNVCLAYEFASLFNKKNFKDKCLGFITRNIPLTLKSRSIEDAQLSTLVMILSLDICKRSSALSLFEAVERYVKAQEKRVVSSTNCATVHTLTEPSSTGSKEKLNFRPLLEKIHFLTLTPEEFFKGPAISGLLTESEVYAIIMNIASHETHIPMPSGFSTYRHITNSLNGGGRVSSVRDGGELCATAARALLHALTRRRQPRPIQKHTDH